MLTSRPSFKEAFEARAMRWGVFLAGGDGVRLRSLTRTLFGDDRPKQFCPLVTGQTLLAQTVRRAKSSIPGGQILFAFTRAHREFYLRETGAPASQRIVQPFNKGTFSVLSIHQLSEDALIAILPSDHHYADDGHFTAALESGFEIAASHGDSIALIGAHPDRPEIEYGGLSWVPLPRTTGTICCGCGAFGRSQHRRLHRQCLPSLRRGIRSSGSAEPARFLMLLNLWFQIRRRP